MDSALVGGLIGLAGAAVGSVTAVLVGRLRENREDQRARDVSAREELRSAILDFCAAVLDMEATELRRWGPEAKAVMTVSARTLAGALATVRWVRKARAADVARAEELKKANYRARRRAEVALFRLQLATANDAVQEAAAEAFDLTRHFRDASAEDVYRERLVEIRAALKLLNERGEVRLHREGSV